MAESYTSKVLSKPPCLISKIKLEKLNRPLACWTVYCASNCTDFSNFIFAIKQGGLGRTLEIYDSLIAQLA